MAAGARLTLLPYAYLADPLPVYHQSQDTRAGVHAYSYAGGPSAKEEVRGLDGVTRGSYSYIDAHGILQSVFYVADEGGFRVAATNLPTDDNLQLETSEILLARNVQSVRNSGAVVPEIPKEENKKAEESATNRRKRSLETPVDQDRRQVGNPGSQADQADRGAANVSPKSSHELPASEKKAEGRTILAPAYRLLDTVLIPRLNGLPVSHQSRVDVHNNVRLKAVQPVETIGVLSESPAYEAVILPSQVPLATSHQSRVQVHNNLRVEVPEKLLNAETVELVQSQTPVAAVELQPLPLTDVLSNYNEKRIELHRSIGLEGPNPKNTVRIDAPQVPLIEAPIAQVRTIPILAKEALPVLSKDALPVLSKDALPVLAKDDALPVVVKDDALPVVVKNDALPVVVKEPLPVLARETVPAVIKETVPIVAKGVVPIVTEDALPVITAVSNQSRTQIHRNTKLVPQVLPITNEPAVYLATSYSQPIAHLPILAPIAQSSQYRSQIHSNDKIELSK